MSSKGLRLFLNCIFVVVFNVILFMFVQVFTVTFWVSYAFIHVAYIMGLIASYASPKGRSSAVLGYPLVSISWTYFLLEFIIGLTFLIFKNASFKVSFIPQFVLLAIYAFLFVSNVLANEATVSNEKMSALDNLYIKRAASEVNLLMNIVTDPSLRKKMERLYDSLMGSQVRSNPSVRDVENRIMSNIASLRELMRDNNYVKANSTILALQGLVDERNSKISLGRL